MSDVDWDHLKPKLCIRAVCEIRSVFFSVRRKHPGGGARFHAGWLCNWQAEREYRALSQLAGHGDATSMRLYNGLYDGQSHSGTLHAITLALPAVELVEDQRA